MEKADVAQRFWDLFSPLPRAYGVYVPLSTYNEHGKREGKAITKKEPLTLDLFLKHLDAGDDDDWTLGAIPIRDDAMVQFAVIDIDQYNGTLNIPRLAEQSIGDFGMPICWCKSKSGGGHGYIFFSEPVPAAMVRPKLEAWTNVLGYPGVEIFPKQKYLKDQNEVGNWINLPFQGAAGKTGGTERWGFNDKGKQITKLGDWLKYAYSKRVDAKFMEEFELPDTSVPFEDGPPCLQALAGHGVEHGGRNNVLFNMGIYAREKFPDQVQGKLHDFNKSFIDPPLSDRELDVLLKSVTKKNYYYRCNEHPCAEYCHRNRCLTRQYGIGEAISKNQVLEFGSLQKQVVIDTHGEETDDEPLYFWTINGQLVTISMSDILNQNAFARIVAEKINVVPATIKANHWKALVQDALDNLQVIHAPFESGLQGQFINLLYIFLAERYRGDTKAELWDGATYHDKEQKRLYFRWADLYEFLNQRRFQYSQKLAWATMRKYADAIDHDETVGNKHLRAWSVSDTNIIEATRAVPSMESEY